MVQVLFAGGGTGGHLYPGIALALALREGREPAESLFLCSDRGLDRSEAERYGFPAKVVPAVRWKGVSSLPAIAWGVAAGLAKTAWTMAQRGRLPSVTVGLGGYASFAPALLSRLLGRPLVLLEQNVVPGRANRILSRLATRIYSQWEESVGRFPYPSRVRCAGNPIRPEVTGRDRAEARRSLGVDGEGLVVAVLGGSQGSQALNALLIAAAPLLAETGMHVIHVVGRGGDRVGAERAYERAGVKARVEEYCDRMGELYAATDVAICRAGGTTIAELTAKGIPAVLIPYPHAAEDHQRANARALEARGAAIVLEEGEATPERLAEALRGLVSRPEALARMRRAALAAARPEAARKLASELFRLASR